MCFLLFHFSKPRKQVRIVIKYTRREDIPRLSLHPTLEHVTSGIDLTSGREKGTRDKSNEIHIAHLREN